MSVAIVCLPAAIVFVLPQPSAASERRDCPTDIGSIGQGQRAFSAVMTIKLISWFETIIANPAISVSELETIISNPDIRFKEVGGSLGVYINKVEMHLLRFAPTWNDVGCVSTMPNEKNSVFSLHCLRLALLYGCAVKVGGTSRIKINEFILYSLRFALPLHLYGNKSSYYGGSRKAERAY